MSIPGKCMATRNEIKKCTVLSRIKEKETHSVIQQCTLSNYEYWISQKISQAVFYMKNNLSFLCSIPEDEIHLQCKIEVTERWKIQHFHCPLKITSEKAACISHNLIFKHLALLIWHTLFSHTKTENQTQLIGRIRMPLSVLAQEDCHSFCQSILQCVKSYKLPIKSQGDIVHLAEFHFLLILSLSSHPHSFLHNERKILPLCLQADVEKLQKMASSFSGFLSNYPRKTVIISQCNKYV